MEALVAEKAAEKAPEILAKLKSGQQNEMATAGGGNEINAAGKGATDGVKNAGDVVNGNMITDVFKGLGGFVTPDDQAANGAGQAAAKATPSDPNKGPDQGQER
jgi:hypothetical protein